MSDLYLDHTINCNETWKKSNYTQVGVCFEGHISIYKVNSSYIDVTMSIGTGRKFKKRMSICKLYVCAIYNYRNSMHFTKHIKMHASCCSQWTTHVLFGCAAIAIYICIIIYSATVHTVLNVHLYFLFLLCTTINFVQQGQRAEKKVSYYVLISSKHQHNL
jgi:hypothetical protein